MDNKNNRKKLYEYNNVLKSIDDCYRNIAKRYGFSEAAFWTLYTLRMEPGNITQSDVCTVLYQPKQTVNSVVAGMVRRGYVELEVIPGTRNKKVIRLTGEGRAFGDRIISKIYAAEQRALEKMTGEERLDCVRLLTKYADLLREEL